MASLLLLASTLPLVVFSHVKGVIPLDSFTFDKIVDGNRDVLVKFDNEYPYVPSTTTVTIQPVSCPRSGKTEQEFKKLAATVSVLTGTRFLLAGVGVQRSGTKDNDDLRERFRLNRDEFPVFKLFKKGGKKPIHYHGGITYNTLITFLKSEIGLYIALPGTPCLSNHVVDWSF